MTPDHGAGAAGAAGAAGQVELRQAQRHLAAARDVLAGRTGLPPRRCTRAASLFARTALELLVDGALAGRGHQLSRAGMRVKLICLRLLVDPAAGDDAEIAWAGLSQGCHEHAYELAPGWAQVHHLIELVQRVAALVDVPPHHRTDDEAR